jgi:hypothetical protein
MEFTKYAVFIELICTLKKTKAIGIAILPINFQCLAVKHGRTAKLELTAEPRYEALLGGGFSE